MIDLMKISEFLGRSSQADPALTAAWENHRAKQKLAQTVKSVQEWAGGSGPKQSVGNIDDIFANVEGAFGAGASPVTPIAPQVAKPAPQQNTLARYASVMDRLPVEMAAELLPQMLTEYLKPAERKITNVNGVVIDEADPANPLADYRDPQRPTVVNNRVLDPNDPTKVLANYSDPEGEESAFGGTGLENQAYSTLIRIKEKREQGQPISRRDELASQAALSMLSQPKIIMLADGRQVQMPGADLSWFAGGGQPEPSPGPPRPNAGGLPPGAVEIGKRPKTVEQARGDALVREARKMLPLLTEVSPDGKPDRALLAEMWTAVPGSRGATLRNAFNISSGNRIRLESGANITDSEVESQKQKYLPTPWDSDEIIQQKIDGLNTFFDSMNETMGGNADEYSEEDLKFTAQQHGITVEEVKRRLAGSR